jgi:predicted nucleotidyltransferase
MPGGGDYPGTVLHQRVLAAVVAHFAADPRVLGVVLFGSLARGDWDEYSDLDLDIVLASGVAISAMDELERLCAALTASGERVAAVVPKRADEGDVVLVSLLELSIRFHPLASTSPNIVEGARVLWGSITEEDIRAAGRANAPAELPTLAVLRDRCVRALLEADVALQRKRLWFAIEQLNLARDQIIALFAAVRGAPRPLHAFQQAADERLSAQLAATLPTARWRRHARRSSPPSICWRITWTRSHADASPSPTNSARCCARYARDRQHSRWNDALPLSGAAPTGYDALASAARAAPSAWMAWLAALALVAPRCASANCACRAATRGSWPGPLSRCAR